MSSGSLADKADVTYKVNVSFIRYVISRARAEYRNDLDCIVFDLIFGSLYKKCPTLYIRVIQALVKIESHRFLLHLLFHLGTKLRSPSSQNLSRLTYWHAFLEFRL
jgi:hypothetical protein